jgi:hypothetical protein
MLQATYPGQSRASYKAMVEAQNLGPRESRIMRNWAKALVFALLLLAVPVAYADGTASPVTMKFVNVNGVNDGSYYVSPYTGTMNGNPVTLFCDDFNNDVTWNQTWQANVTSLGSNDLSNTRYGNSQNVAQLLGTDPYFNTFTSTQLYEQAAWLTTQFGQYLSNPNGANQVIALQYAIWDLFDPNAPTNAAALVWISKAQQNDGWINPNDFLIVTNTGPLTLTGQVQEFIVRTPEPGSAVLLGAGLLALAFYSRRKLHASGRSQAAA